MFSHRGRYDVPRRARARNRTVAAGSRARQSRSRGRRVRDDARVRDIPLDRHRCRSSRPHCARKRGYMIGLMWSFTLLAALTTSGAHMPVPQDERALLQLQQDLAKAWVIGDRAAIERIIAPDWKSTGPDGRMTDRPSVVNEVFERRIHRIRRLAIDDVTARVFGDAAVVTGRTHGVGDFDGAAYDVVIRFTDTFVRIGGRWQAVASHASVVSARQ